MLVLTEQNDVSGQDQISEVVLILLLQRYQFEAEVLTPRFPLQFAVITALPRIMLLCRPLVTGTHLDTMYRKHQLLSRKDNVGPYLAGAETLIQHSA